MISPDAVSVLQENAEYSVRITATDASGVQGSASTDPVVVVAESHSLSPGAVVGIVIAVLLLSFVTAVALTNLAVRTWCAPPACQAQAAPGMAAEQLQADPWACAHRMCVPAN